MKSLDFKVNGFLFSGISAGIKKDGKRDLGLIYSEVPAQVAGLFHHERCESSARAIGYEAYEERSLSGNRCE